MICAIATPCAASAYNSAMNADIPIVYTAVSDPVVAGLAKEDGSSVGNITGSSDVLPVEEQLKMIRQMMPDAKKIGILYTCLLYTSPSPRDGLLSRMPSSA